MPDLGREFDDLIGGLELAFVAFNKGDVAKFIVRSPTPVADDLTVYHYSKTLRLQCRNRLIRL